MPQMLSNYPGAVITSYGYSVLSNHFPNIAAPVLQTINAQAHADATLDNMFVYLMGTEPRKGFAALDALSGAEARRDALKAVAKQVLSKENYEVFQAVLQFCRTARSRRNDFAHSLWGVATRPADAAILIRPAAIATALVADREVVANNGLLGLAQLSGGPAKIDPSQCYVYTQAEAEQTAKDSLSALALTMQLFIAVTVFVDHSNEALLKLLRNQHQVAPILQKMFPQPTP